MTKTKLIRKQVEERCVTCGDPWNETAPPCCYAPVNDYLTVTRKRQPTGRTLEEVHGHDGEVIAAAHVAETA